MPKHAGGRPPKYRKDFHPLDFVEKSKGGKNITQIACDWNVVRETLYAWGRSHSEFSDALKKGREYCEAWYTNLGQLAMLDQATVKGKKVNINLGFFVWMTKNVIKWTDKVEQKSEVIAELNTGQEREIAMKKLFSSEKAKELALQLAEELEAQHERDNGP